MTNQNPTPTAEQKPSLKDAYFAYRQTGEGWYSVAFGSGKRYGRGFEGRKKLAARCEAAVEKNLADTYAVVDLETYEVTDLYGAPPERADGSLLILRENTPDRGVAQHDHRPSL